MQVARDVGQEVPESGKGHLMTERPAQSDQHQEQKRVLQVKSRAMLKFPLLHATGEWP